MKFTDQTDTPSAGETAVGLTESIKPLSPNKQSKELQLITCLKGSRTNDLENLSAR